MSGDIYSTPYTAALELHVELLAKACLPALWQQSHAYQSQAAISSLSWLILQSFAGMKPHVLNAAMLGLPSDTRSTFAPA